MNISVVVPTYKRLNELKRCLVALDSQTFLPYEVVVVVRLGDIQTLSYIQNWIAQKTLYSRKFCIVSTPGLVRALIRGTEAASGDVVAFTDDDAAPDSRWLFKIQRYYHNPKVGGVGGRDILVNHPAVPLQSKVGVLTWYGKLIGNHHLGCGPPREVDVLKGVNMSFRRPLVEFSSFLRSRGGPETHNEVGMCLRVKRLGYSLVYDPTITVDHYAAPRVDTEQRTQFNVKSVEDSAFNLQISLLTWLPWHQKLLRFLYSMWIGDKAYPGLVRCLTAVVRREVRVVKSYFPAQVGFLIAIMFHIGRIVRGGSKTSLHPLKTSRQKLPTKDVGHVGSRYL